MKKYYITPRSTVYQINMEHMIAVSEVINQDPVGQDVLEDADAEGGVDWGESGYWGK